MTKQKEGKKRESKKPTVKAAPEVREKPEPKKARKIAIVGCSPSKVEAPWDDPSWEIWGVNNLHYHIPRWDRWFEIHLLKFEDGHFWRRSDFDQPRGTFHWSLEFRGQKVDDYVAGLATLGCPIYMQQRWPQIPTSIPYPIDDMVAKFGNYFTNTISYMLALAIDKDPDELGVWGVDMAVMTEYSHQRSSCEYFIGLWDGIQKIKGTGKKLYIPETADLLKTRYLYGFQEKEAAAWTKKLRALKVENVQKTQAAAQREEQAKQERFYREGIAQAYRELDKIWS